MSEEFGADFITITDEDGQEFELEHLETIEYNGQTYMAFFPAVQGEEGDNVQDLSLIHIWLSSATCPSSRRCIWT